MSKHAYRHIHEPRLYTPAGAVQRMVKTAMGDLCHVQRDDLKLPSIFNIHLWPLEACDRDRDRDRDRDWNRTTRLDMILLEFAREFPIKVLA